MTIEEYISFKVGYIIISLLDILLLAKFTRHSKLPFQTKLFKL